MNDIIYRRIPLSDTPNFRDLGGYATARGGVTRFGVFYRSACPNSLNKSDAELLKSLNVTTAVDLRGGSNADEIQRGFICEGITVHTIPIGTNEIPRRAVDVPAGYMRVTEHPNFAEVFKILADCNGAAVFHCFAGKDRTGIVAALLLMLAGVADTDVIADYTLSYAYFLKRLRQDFLRTDAEANVFRPLPEHIEEFLKLFRQRYGTVDNCLLDKGVTEEQINRITDKFVYNP